MIAMIGTGKVTLLPMNIPDDITDYICNMLAEKLEVPITCERITVMVWAGTTDYMDVNNLYIEYNEVISYASKNNYYDITYGLNDLLDAIDSVSPFYMPETISRDAALFVAKLVENIMIE